MTALSDYLLSAHIGYVNASIRGEKPLPFRPLAKLPDPQRTDAQPTAGGIPEPANPYQRAGVAGGDSQ